MSVGFIVTQRIWHDINIVLYLSTFAIARYNIINFPDPSGQKAAHIVPRLSLRIAWIIPTQIRAVD